MVPRAAPQIKKTLMISLSYLHTCNLLVANLPVCSGFIPARNGTGMVEDVPPFRTRFTGDGERDSGNR